MAHRSPLRRPPRPVVWPGVGARPRMLLPSPSIDPDSSPISIVPDVVRGYLSALSRSQVQRLAAGQGNAQGLYGLVGDGRHDSLCSLALLANVGVTPYALAADVDRRAGDQLTRVLALAAEGAGEARLLLMELFSEVQMPQRLSPDVLLRDHPVAQIQALVADVHGRRTRKQRDVIVSDAAERTGITLHGGNPCRSYPQLDV